MTAAGDDADRVGHALTVAGVSGVNDFGHFVNSSTHFRASEFDEKAAMPTLLAVLPSLTDLRVVTAVAGHLRRAWARPSAFPLLRDAFVRWAEVDDAAGWALGDALGTAADKSRVGELIELAADGGYGMSRQTVVHSLRRFKNDQRVSPVLTKLLTDPSVALNAAGALRQVPGKDAAFPLLRAARDQTTDPTVAAGLVRNIKKAQKS